MYIYLYIYLYIYIYKYIYTKDHHAAGKNNAKTIANLHTPEVLVPQSVDFTEPTYGTPNQGIVTPNNNISLTTPTIDSTMRVPKVPVSKVPVRRGTVEELSSSGLYKNIYACS